MDTVNEGGDTAFYGQIVEGSDIKEVGSRVVKAFDAKQKFFHFEFFRLGKDKAGLGKRRSCWFRSQYESTWSLYSRYDELFI